MRIDYVDAGRRVFTTCKFIPMNLPEVEERMIRGLDHREMPFYSLRECGRYLGVPIGTLRHWISGKNALIHPADPKTPLLSFYDLASAHMILAFRQKHKIPLGQIRESMDYFVQIYPSKYPLISHNFDVFGKQIIIEHLGSRLSLTRRGQYAFEKIIDRFLERIERDADGLPLRLAPLRTIRGKSKTDALIVIDPSLSCGRPVIRGTGIMARTVYKRNKHGESAQVLARDLHLKLSEVKEAIKYCKAEESPKALQAA